jgi:tetratricopeptide (TPR) repeat protein
MYEKAVKELPDFYILWGLLAEAHYWDPDQQHKAPVAFRKAIDLAEAQLDANQDDVILISNLATYYVALGDHSRAEALLEQAVNLEPSIPDVILHIADTYERLGRRETALEWVGRALDQGLAPMKINDYPGLRTLRADERCRRLLEGIEDTS